MTGNTESKIAAAAHQVAADVRREDRQREHGSTAPKDRAGWQSIVLSLTTITCLLLTMGNLAGWNPFGPRVAKLTPAEELASREVVAALGTEWVEDYRDSHGQLPDRFEPGDRLGPWEFVDGGDGSYTVAVAGEAEEMN